MSTTIDHLEGAHRALDTTTTALKSAHAHLHDTNRALLLARRDLADAGARHTLAGLEGKNAEARKAELANLTAEEQGDVVNAESIHRDAQLQLTLAELDYRLAREVVASA